MGWKHAYPVDAKKAISQRKSGSGDSQSPRNRAEFAIRDAKFDPNMGRIRAVGANRIGMAGSAPRLH